MSRFVSAALVALAACGGGDSPDPARPVDACGAGDLGACIAASAARCTPDHAWRLRFRDLPPFAVAATGVLRLDHLGGRLYSIDATRFAACFADCPGGGGERTCFPLELPLRLGAEAAALAADPARAPVQRAVVAAGVIESSELGAASEETPALEALEPAVCGDLALPPGFRRALSADDVAALAGIAAEPARATARQSRALLEPGGKAAIAAATDEVLAWVAANRAEACRAAGHDPADRVALERCAAALPETEPRYRDAVARALVAERRARRAELDAITLRELVGPVCRAYAARAR